MTGDLYLGIDVGGTDVKMGLVDRQGKIHHHHHRPTAELVTPAKVFEYALQYARRCLTESSDDPSQLKGIGVAVPGVLDANEGVLREVVNLPGWLGVSLRKLLHHSAENLPCTLINDANAAAYAEHVCRGLADRSLALLTLGTGIGCGLVLSGRPHGGDNGCAGELGHIAVDFSDDALPCSCGSQGHLESYAGAPAVVANLRRRLEGQNSSSIPQCFQSADLTTKDIAEHAEQGNEICIDLVRDTAGYVGKAIGMLGQVCNPAVVVLGGAMTFGGEQTSTGRLFLESIRSAVKRTTLVQVGGNMDIQFASLGNDAGVSGAAMAARHLVDA